MNYHSFKRIIALISMANISCINMSKLVPALVSCMMFLSISDVHAEINFEEIEGIEIQWRSNNNSKEQLALDLEQLYIVLYNTGNLPIKKFTDTEGCLMESILRSEGMFYGKFFPVGIEAVICDINPGVCSRPLEKISTQLLPEAASHVGGYEKTRGHWTNQAGSTLYIPNLRLDSFTTLSQVPYTQGVSVEEMLSTQAADCNQWQKSCLEVVQQLNQASLDPKRINESRPKKILLPVNRFKTDLVFTGIQNSVVKQTLEDIGTLSQKNIVLPREREQFFTKEYGAVLQMRAPADIATHALMPYIPSAGTVKQIKKKAIKPQAGSAAINSERPPELWEVPESSTPVSGWRGTTNPVGHIQVRGSEASATYEELNEFVRDDHLEEISLGSSSVPISMGTESTLATVIVEESLDMAADESMPDYATDDPLWIEHMALLSLIHHPIVKLTDVPQALRKPISIMVLDTWIDKEHCELQHNVALLYDLPQLGSSRTEAINCGDIMVQPPNRVDDHGTHVAGLIAAFHPDKANAVGLNPFAKLQYIFVDMDQLRTQQGRIDLGNQILISIVAKDVKTANISWAYTNQIGQDYIGKIIETLKSTMLFVVAAGNSAESRDEICGDRPACLSDLPNVITVVGLNRNPDRPELWREEEQGSNWSQKFALGAIAEDVLSTTYQNYTGRLSGTSQAAPQVTAAASLIYSVHETIFRVDEPELLPVRVKNRLIYTSDLFGGLLDKVQGGRLNVERALDMANDYVTIKKNGELKTIKGTLVRFGNDQNNEYIECRRQDGSLEQIKREDLRRMFFDKGRNKYVIFKNSKSNNRDSPIQRITDCQLRTRSHIASIEQNSGEEIEFQFRDIQDFISAMY